jgi:hypothetical protein
MKKRPWAAGALLAAAAFLTLAGCPALLEEDPFVPVADISGVPDTGTAGLELNLNTAAVNPAGAANKNIIWKLLAPGDTGVLEDDLADGRFIPAEEGTLRLLARIENGKAPGSDYEEIFDIEINPAPPPPPPVGYTLTADGSAGTETTSALSFVFTEALEGLGAEDIRLGKDGDTGEVTKGALDGGGEIWTLALDGVAEPGDLTVSISREGIEEGEKIVRVHKQGETPPPPVTYTLTADGTANTVTSTALSFVFSAAVEGLGAADINLGKAGDTGAAAKGALSGGGTSWTLALGGVTTAGSLTVSVARAGIEGGEKTVTVHKQGETPPPSGIGYTVTANGTANTVTSTALSFSFSAALSALAAEDIRLGGAGDTGEVVKGALSGGGASWTLALDEVSTAGNIRVSISREGIAGGVKTVRVHKQGETPPPPVSYTVQADGSAHTAASTALSFSFSAALSALTAADIRLGKDGDTSAAAKGALSGGGQSWTLALGEVTAAGNLTVSIARDGIEDGEKTVAVYKHEPSAEPAVPPAPAKPVITLIKTGSTQDTPGQGGEIHLSWQAVEGAASYELYYAPKTAEDPVIPGSPAKTVNAPARSAVISDSGIGGETMNYHVWVKAVNAAGKSAASPPASSLDRFRGTWAAGNGLDAYAIDNTKIRYLMLFADPGGAYDIDEYIRAVLPFEGDRETVTFQGQTGAAGIIVVEYDYSVDDNPYWSHLPGKYFIAHYYYGLTGGGEGIYLGHAADLEAGYGGGDYGCEVASVEEALERFTHDDGERYVFPGVAVPYHREGPE